MTSMGFTIEQAESALDITHGETENAVILLLENPQTVMDHRRSRTAPLESLKNTPAATAFALNKSKSFMTIGESTKSTVETSGSRHSLNKSNSFSFSKSTDPNPLSKVGNFLGNAMDAFRTDFKDSSPIELSDTFTVYSGSQVRAMNNLRLQVASHASYFQSNQDPIQQVAIRAQTCISLYSQSLSGIVVLLKPSDFKTYCTPSSVNRGSVYLI